MKTIAILLLFTTLSLGQYKDKRIVEQSAQKLWELMGQYISECRQDSTIIGKGVTVTDSLGTDYIILTEVDIKTLKLKKVQNFIHYQEPTPTGFAKWLKSRGY